MRGASRTSDAGTYSLEDYPSLPAPYSPRRGIYRRRAGFLNHSPEPYQPVPRTQPPFWDEMYPRNSPDVEIRHIPHVINNHRFTHQSPYYPGQPNPSQPVDHLWESTAWDVYNNEARKVDDELVKDWSASLHFLLVFAAIFAAVLSAFIIESKKMLEEDPNSILLDAVVFHMANLANGTHIPFERSMFAPVSVAISVNCFLFASLGVTLVAALASVVALQWVADYDAAITRGGSSPEDRAKRRQFRFAGAVGWKMGEIIAALPLLLYLSVALFWAGTIQWMWSIHHTVGYVVAGGTSLAVLFYMSTTFIAAAYVSAPFRTPLSRGLFWGSQVLRSTATWAYEATSIKPLLGPVLELSSAFLRITTHAWSLLAPILTTYITFINKPRTSTRAYPRITSRQREDRAAKRDPWLKQQSLEWLARQLPISSDSHHRMGLVLMELPNLPSTTSLSPSFLNAPWLEILDSLSNYYLQHIVDGIVVNGSGDLDVICTIVRCANLPEIKGLIAPGPEYEQDPAQTLYWTQCCLRANNFRDPPPTEPRNSTFLLARDIPVPTTGYAKDAEATIKLIKWRNTAGFKEQLVWEDIFLNIRLYSPQFIESCLRCFERVTVWQSLLPVPVQPPPISDHQPAPPESAEEAIPGKVWDFCRIFSGIAATEVPTHFNARALIALVQAFESSITQDSLMHSRESGPYVLRRPMLYGRCLAERSAREQETHYEITCLLAQFVNSSIQKDSQLLDLILEMLTLGHPAFNPTYFGSHRADSGMEGLGISSTDIWDTSTMEWTKFAHQIPHIVTIILILESIQLNSGDLEPLWLLARDERSQREQFTWLIEAFDNIISLVDNPPLHSAMIRLICRDIELAGNKCARGSFYFNGPVQWMTRLRDPCLATISRHVAGILVPIELPASYPYKYNRSVDAVALHLYQRAVIGDQPALWQLRAAVSLVDSWILVNNYYKNALQLPEKLSQLHAIFQYPTLCHCRTSSVPNMLFHIYQFSPAFALSPQDVVAFADLNLGTRIALRPALLTLPDTYSLASLAFVDGDGQDINRDCVEAVWRFCNSIRHDPAAFIPLIDDMASEPAIHMFWPKNIAAILICVGNATALQHHEMATPYLRPLARTLRKLRRKLLWYKKGTQDDRFQVAKEAERLYKLLQAQSCQRLVSSLSQSRVLSCARARTCTRPAMGWLEIYLGV